MKSIMAKYNHAFGYIKGFFFMDFAFAGIVCIVMGIASPFMAESFSAGGVAGLALIPAGIVLLLIVALIFRSTLKKCPEDHNGPVGLAIWMIIAGLLACFAFAWWFIKLVFHISAGE